MKKQHLSPACLSALCAELSLLLQAGISADDGLALLRDDERDAALKALLDRLYQAVDAGAPLWQALGEAGGFPDYLVRMVQLGETTGRLDDVLTSLSAYYDEQGRLSAAICSAVSYPAVLLVMTAVVILLLLTRVLPIFQQVFAQLGASLPPLTLGLMYAGRILTWVLAALALLAAAVGLAVLLLRKNSACRAKLDALWANVFGNSRLGRENAAARFAAALSLGLSSGLETDQMLDLAEHLCTSPVLSEKAACCRAALDAGEGFADALGSSGIFTARDSRLLSVAFRAGRADEVMRGIARRSEEAAHARISAQLDRIEPAIVIILSVTVGLILCSVMLPLVSVMSAIG